MYVPRIVDFECAMDGRFPVKASWVTSPIPNYLSSSETEVHAGIISLKREAIFWMSSMPESHWVVSIPQRSEELRPFSLV